jgi:hypothetical protein
MKAMWKQVVIGIGCAGAAALACATPGLTDTENRWLDLAAPALRYAREQKLPLDIVVQPQPTPGYAPLAMAFIDGRCKLVLSMRGNPEAQSTLDEIEPELLAPVVEAMTAHEIGHCWRYVRGAWNTVPAGFVDHKTDDADELADAKHQMASTRREEGFADLVGLAWTRRAHPALYARVHTWFAHFRADEATPGSHHDTVAWIRLAEGREAFGSDDSLFDQAWPLWQRGLFEAR